MADLLGWGAALGLALALGCGGGGTPEASSADVVQLVENGAILLDVRTPSEFADGHVDGAVNVPVQELEARIGELDASRSVVVYCRSGNRSATAAGVLRERGFEVTDLGPMSAWPRQDEIVR